MCLFRVRNDFHRFLVSKIAFISTTRFILVRKYFWRFFCGTRKNIFNNVILPQIFIFEIEMDDTCIIDGVLSICDKKSYFGDLQKSFHVHHWIWLKTLYLNTHKTLFGGWFFTNKVKNWSKVKNFVINVLIP